MLVRHRYILILWTYKLILWTYILIIWTYIRILWTCAVHSPHVEATKQELVFHEIGCFNRGNPVGRAWLARERKHLNFVQGGFRSRSSSKRRSAIEFY